VVDQRPSRAFPARYAGNCAGATCGEEIAVGDSIRLHYGIAYHDDPDCLPAISAWGERRPSDDAPNEPADPWA
jgi:hypothetical protein